MGVYRYGYALTVEAAQNEARAMVDAIKGRKMPCRVGYDTEWNEQRKLPKSIAVLPKGTAVRC